MCKVQANWLSVQGTVIYGPGDASSKQSKAVFFYILLITYHHIRSVENMQVKTYIITQTRQHHLFYVCKKRATCYSDLLTPDIEYMHVEQQDTHGDLRLAVHLRISMTSNNNHDSRPGVGNSFPQGVTFDSGTVVEGRTNRLNSILLNIICISL